MFDLFASGHHPPAPQNIMEIDQVMLLIERLGLPALIIGACMFYIWKTQLAHRQEIQEWNAKDSKADERLIEVIKEQNTRNEHMFGAISELTISNKDVTKSNERSQVALEKLADRIEGMMEALISENVVSKRRR
tara:strand:- start:2296 stop:2697 length:402 start_codon:yes stop_codon:yes gene_type:complete